MSEANDGYNNKSGLTSKIQIPYFDPASTKISARSWIAYVELARDSAGTKWKEGVDTKESVWSDEQTCTNAMLLLQGTANKWGIHILENDGDELKIWAKFKASFKERFIQSLTLNEKMNLRDLKMSAVETCRDFYDRCTNNINLFYEDEWEQLVLKAVEKTTPWVDPGKEVIKNHIDISKVFLKKTKDIELKLAFASGLKESIKRQVLFQESDSVKEILKIAQRIEAGLKELKKSEISILDVDHSDYDVSADVAAINFKKKKKFQAGAKPGGQKGQLKCYYCLKTGHFKDKCMSMKNDRQKGIFRSNINSAPVKARNNSVEADDSSSDDESHSVNNCGVDISRMLNIHSA